MNLGRFFQAAPVALALLACSQKDPIEPTAQLESSPGTLVITANGEDFVRQGFVSKDGWQIDFDSVYVTLAELKAYQSDPPFEPEKQALPKAQETVEVASPITVDLAEGDEDAEPIVVAEINDAPGGRYNALSWTMVSPKEGPATGYPLMLVGTATKAGEAIDFQLQMSESLKFVCGDFIGDTRKGMLSSGETTDVEATFHFDHLFGDAEAPADDEINTGALGFEPIAALAENGEVSLTSDDLEQNLSKEDYKTLQTLLPSLGHVGEGHCEETLLN